MLTVKKTFTLCFIKNVFLFKNMETPQKKTSKSICRKKMKNQNVIIIQMKMKALLNMVMTSKFLKFQVKVSENVIIE